MHMYWHILHISMISDEFNVGAQIQIIQPDMVRSLFRCLPINLLLQG